jgi:hypothetical protein
MSMGRLTEQGSKGECIGRYAPALAESIIVLLENEELCEIVRDCGVIGVTAGTR